MWLIIGFCSLIVTSVLLKRSFFSVYIELFQFPPFLPFLHHFLLLPLLHSREVSLICSLTHLLTWLHFHSLPSSFEKLYSEQLCLSVCLTVFLLPPSPSVPPFTSVVVCFVIVAICYLPDCCLSLFYPFTWSLLHACRLGASRSQISGTGGKCLARAPIRQREQVCGSERTCEQKGGGNPRGGDKEMAG